MSAVIHRTTLEYRPLASTGRFDPADWIINPDLSALAAVDKKYWKIVGDTVVEMDQGEKDAVDVIVLQQLKDEKSEVARERTDEIYDAGFEHPAASGDWFPLRSDNRLDWLAAGELGTSLTYPFKIMTRDDQAVSVANNGSLQLYRGAAVTRSMLILAAQNDLIESYQAAVDEAALDALVDSR